MPPRDEDTPNREMEGVRIRIGALQNEIDTLKGAVKNELEAQRFALREHAEEDRRLHKRISEDNQLIFEALNGLPTSTEPGIRGRVDRLEQAAITRNRVWIAVITALSIMLLQGAVNLYLSIQSWRIQTGARP